MPKPLSQKESDIITALRFDAEITVAELSRITGFREHVVRSAINSLRKRGILQFRPYVSPYAIGQVEYGIFFKLVSAGDVARRRLARALCASPRTKFITFTEGEFQVCGTLLCRTHSDIEDFFDRLAVESDGVLFECVMVTNISVTNYLPKYLRGRKGRRGMLSYSQDDTPTVLDEIDHKILHYLNLAKDVNYTTITRQVGIARSTLDYRVQSLRERGVLLGLGYRVRYETSTRSSHYLLLKFHRIDAITRTKFANYCANHPNVPYMISLIGLWNYEIGIVTDHASEISAIVQNLRLEFQKEISSVQVLQEFEILKGVEYPIGGYSSITVKNKKPVGQKS